MALSIITDALGSRARAKVKGIEDMSGVLQATQDVVDTLTPPGGGRYVVTLKDAATASTDVYGKRIVITSKPLFDSSILQAEAAEVMTGLVAHEIGHAIFDGVDLTNALRARNEHPAYFKVHNMLADHRLERRMRVRYPMIGPAFTTMLRWVAKFYDYQGRPALKAEREMKPIDRYNFALCAVRYAKGVKWSNDALTRAERRRWIGWADQYTADDTDDLHFTGCDVAYGWLRDEATPEPEPEDEPEPEPEPDERGDEPGPTGPGPDEDDEDDEDDESEDEDGPSGWTDPDDDEDDEPEDDEDDEPEPTTDDEDDESEPEDEDEGGESKGTDGDDEPDEDEDDESEPDEDEGGGEIGSGKPEADDLPTENPDDDMEWDPRREAKDVHDRVQTEYGQDRLADDIAKFDGRVKATFGAFGSMTAQWHD